MHDEAIHGFELSPQQKRLWSQGRDGVEGFRAQVAIAIEGPLDADSLQDAVAAVIARHEILRTRFRRLAELSWPVQVVESPQEVVVEWAPATAGELSEARLDEVLEAQRSLPIDATAGAALRAAVMALPARRHLLLLTLPALCADRRTLRNLVREIERAYAARRPGGAPGSELAEPVQYADISAVFGELLEGPDTLAGRRYWREQSLPPGPADARRAPAAKAFSPRWIDIGLAPALGSGLEEAMERVHASPYEFFLTCWAVLVWHRLGRSAAVIGAEFDGRAYEGLPEAMGLFSRYLPISVPLRRDRLLEEVVDDVRQAAGKASERQDFFAPIAEDGAALPSFPFCFELHSEPAESSPGSFRILREVAFFDRFGMLLACRGGRGQWSLRLHYDAVCHTAEEADRLGQGLVELLASVARRPRAPVGDLEAVGAGERALLIAGLNDTRIDHGEELCLHRLFEGQAARTPERVAAVCGDLELAFSALEQQANRLARRLRRLGAGRGTRIGLACESSLDLVAALLAVLKAGAAYVPLDPSYPRERLAYICQDAQLGLLIADERLLCELPDPGAPLLSLDSLLEGGAAESDGPLATGVTSDDLAYLIYTSGSTGRPKGVMVAHRAICNRLLWMQRVFPLDGHDKVLQKTPLSFDASIWELFLPLFTGATLVLARSGGHQDPAYLVRQIAERGVTVLQLVPSMLQVVLEETAFAACRSLRLVFCGGEGLPRTLAERVRAKLGLDAYNLYGPTECSIDASSWAGGPRAEVPLVPIGRPIDNARLYVLSAELRLVPFGAAGELFIGGAGLARGYSGLPALTGERFVPDPFSGVAGARLYRTGDLVRYLPDGALEFLGRLDSQVKLRGNRIEPGEIEAVLSRHPAVAQAVASVRTEERGDQRLVAWFVPRRAPYPELAEENLYQLPNGQWVAHLNRWETDLIYREVFGQNTYLRRGIELPGSPCIFDVGANIGLFTLFIHQRCPGARVFAFEPVPAVFARLRANMALYGVDAKLFNVAVSRSSGEIQLTYYPRLSSMSGVYPDLEEDQRLARAFLRNQSLRLAQEADELLAGRFESVALVCPVRTLSEVIAEHAVERIDLLKIDVEKSELEVLEGLAEPDWLKVRQIAIEAHDRGGRLERIIDLLHRHGFEVTEDDDGLLRDTGLKNLYAVRPGTAADWVAATRSAVAPPPEPAWLPLHLLGAELRRFAESRLPAVMVPSAFVRLETLPRLPNGKVDVRGLPAPPSSAPTAKAPPATPMQELVAGIWRQVLGVQEVAPSDQFFELGGHSLLAMQVISRLREIGSAQLAVRDLFDSPVLAAFAARVESSIRGAGLEVPEIASVPRHGDLPLSFAQQRLFFLDQLEGDSFAYNVPMAVRLEGRLDAGALLRSFAEIARRHTSLRTTFHLGPEGPVQRIAPRVPPFQSQVDLASLEPARQLEEAERAMTLAARQPFDLARGPLWRVVLVRRSAALHELLAVMHHIVSDGWSTGVLMREIGALYEAFSQGRPSPLPELAIQYVDFAVWQRRWLEGPALDGLLAYWRRRLAGAARLELPADRPRPTADSHRGDGLVSRLPAELSGRLARLSQEEGCTLFMTLLAAYQVLLSRWAGQDDVVVGTDIANRGRCAAEDLIGFFVNLLVLRTSLAGRPSFREVLRRVREVTLEAYAHQDLPFEKLVEELRPERRPGGTPFVQALFVLQNVPAERLELPGLTLTRSVDVFTRTAKFDLALFVAESADGLVAGWNFKTDLFEPATIARLARSYETLLAGVVAGPDRLIDELEIVSGAERKRQSMEKTQQKEAKLQALLSAVPKAAAVAPQALIATELPSGRNLPLIVRPAVPDTDLVDWAKNSREFIERSLGRHGAMLFRGFDVRSVQQFEQFASAVCPDLFGEYGDLPNEESGRKVYKSTPYPADKWILFHNESSHMPSWPLRQFFFCVQSAPHGGETPLLDCRESCGRIDPALLARFREKKLMYVRNFVDGVDVSWQDFFKTEDSAAIEAHCRVSGIDFEWRPDGSLHTRQIAPAVARHPRTGDLVFFNQIQLHHPACLAEDVRQSMESLFGRPADFPRNVLYGDGTPIEDSVVDEIGALYREMAVSLPWQDGDVILVDNMLVAHARKPFSGPRKIVVAMGEMVDRSAIGEA